MVINSVITHYKDSQYRMDDDKPYVYNYNIYILYIYYIYIIYIYTHAIPCFDHVTSIVLPAIPKSNHVDRTEKGSL